VRLIDLLEILLDFANAFELNMQEIMERNKVERIASALIPFEEDDDEDDFHENESISLLCIMALYGLEKDWPEGMALELVKKFMELLKTKKFLEEPDTELIEQVFNCLPTLSALIIRLGSQCHHLLFNKPVITKLVKIIYNFNNQAWPVSFKYNAILLLFNIGIQIPELVLPHYVPLLKHLYYTDSLNFLYWDHVVVCKSLCSLAVGVNYNQIMTGLCSNSALHTKLEQLKNGDKRVIRRVEKFKLDQVEGTTSNSQAEPNVPLVLSLIDLLFHLPGVMSYKKESFKCSEYAHLLLRLKTDFCSSENWLQKIQWNELFDYIPNSVSNWIYYMNGLTLFMRAEGTSGKASTSQAFIAASVGNTQRASAESYSTFEEDSRYNNSSDSPSIVAALTRVPCDIMIETVHYVKYKSHSEESSVSVQQRQPSKKQRTKKM